jgi:hypothetical protein
MPIDDKIVKDWGTIFPSGSHDHITITNDKSNDGPGCHITTRIKGGVTIRQDIGKDGKVNPFDW